MKGCDVDSFTLSCNGRSIRDHVSLDEQGVSDGATVDLHVSGKGGTSKFTILLWLAIIIYAATLFLLLGTGIFNMVAYLYAYLFKGMTDNVFKWIFGLLGDTDFSACIKHPLSWAIKLLNFLVKHSIVFLFVFVAIAALSYPIFGIWYKDHCQSLFLSKKVGVICALLYLFIYGLLYVPNMLYNAAIMVSDLFGTTSVLVSPGLQAQKNAVNDVKYLGFYAIPFVGQGIEQIHYIMSQIVEGVYDGAERFKGVTCKRGPDGSVMIPPALNRTLGEVVNCVRQQSGKSSGAAGCVTTPLAAPRNARTCSIYSDLIQTIKDNKMQDMVEYAWMGLNRSAYDEIEQRYKNAGFFTKIDILGFTDIANCYFNATASRWMVCSMLSTLNDTDDYFSYVGSNVDSIIDTMKRGNIAGMATTSAYALIMIIAMIWPGFLGYL